ncbi:hypothetical protein WH8501_14450 [Crocosphaera watsonii WH 8501]|uniref:hypothetical protein n=1 Tax=Crocosphaera watsonii TaxID=263511 RepID=UPI000039D105|nr:hypothetical protein [Crocosphaera watsonii]
MSLVSHGAALQINAGNDDLCSALEQMPPAALEAFLKGLGQYIANQTPQKKH